MMIQKYSPKSTGNKSQPWMNFAMAMVGTTMMLSGFSANAADSDSICCTSGAACEKMIQDAQASCKTGQASMQSTCVALKGLTSYEWLIHNPDLSPLTSNDKDFAGTYQLSVGNKFVMTNKWLKSDAPGIKANNQSEISLKKICYNTKEVEIKGRVNAFVGFQLSFKTNIQNVQGARGYFGSPDSDKQFFFTPVFSSTRNPVAAF